jgi:hypothetical protein
LAVGVFVGADIYRLVHSEVVVPDVPLMVVLSSTPTAPV